MYRFVFLGLLVLTPPQVTLLGDLYPTIPYIPNGSAPGQFTPLDSTRFIFTAQTEALGRELWVSDGTDAGTLLLGDLTPGSGSTEFGWIVGEGSGFAHACACVPGYGCELWTTNGTPDTTRILTDLNPGTRDGCNPQEPGAMAHSVLWYAGDDGVHGVEPFVVHDTTLPELKELQPGSGGSAATHFTPSVSASGQWFNRPTYFTATVDGTSRVYAANVGVAFGALVFAASVVDFGATLDTVDAHIESGGSQLMIGVKSGVAGTKLYYGTGSTLTAVSMPSGFGTPLGMVRTTGRVYIHDGAHVASLVFSAPTSATLVSTETGVIDLIVAGGTTCAWGQGSTLYAIADGDLSATSLGQGSLSKVTSNGSFVIIAGSFASASLVKKIQGTTASTLYDPSASSVTFGLLSAFAGKIFLSFSHPAGASPAVDDELEVLGPTYARVKNIAPDSNASVQFDAPFAALPDGRALIQGSAGMVVVQGTQLTTTSFLSSPMGVVGGKAVIALNGGSTIDNALSASAIGLPHTCQLEANAISGGVFYAVCKEHVTCSEHCGPGGCPACALDADGRCPANCPNGTERFTFHRYDGETLVQTGATEELSRPGGGVEPRLTASMSTSAGAAPIGYVNTNDDLQINSLRRFDMDTGAEVAGQVPRSYMIGALAGDAVLVAEDTTSVDDYELTRIDANGASLVADINPTASSCPQSFVRVGDLTVFVADDGTHGAELWVTDGTPAGTRLLSDIMTGAGSSVSMSTIDCVSAHSGSSVVSTPSIEWLTFGGKAYFSAASLGAGFELWVTDGTSAGTHIVKDLVPGAASSLPRNFLSLESYGVFVFTAGDDKLWLSDGSADGTRPWTDSLGAPVARGIAGARLYFTAVDPVVGREMWSTDAPSDASLLPQAEQQAFSSMPTHLKIGVMCSGPSSCAGLSLQLTGIAGAVFDGCNASCALPTLASNETQTVDVVMTAPDAGDFSLQLLLQGDAGANRLLTNDRATLAVKVVAPRDLSLQRANDDPLVVGKDPVAVPVIVKNLGTVTATQITVAATASELLSVTTPSQTIAQLGPGEQAEVQVAVVASAAGPAVLRVQVSSPDADPDAGNNQLSIDVTATDRGGLGFVGVTGGDKPGCACSSGNDGWPWALMLVAFVHLRVRRVRKAS